MKRNAILITFSFIFSLFLALNALAYSINDDYWGATITHGWSARDVIGLPEFSIDKMDIVMSGTTLTVKITGDYFHYYNINQSIGGGQTVQNFGPGDLYISSHGWHATGNISDHWQTDVFDLSEGWDYVVSKANAKIYLLTNSGLKETNIEFLDPNAWVYREDQAFIGGYDGSPIDSATVNMDDTGITFSFNTSNMNLGNEIGLHWTMRCGNDVIEGAAPVPEASTIILLGAALLVGGVIIKKTKKK